MVYNMETLIGLAVIIAIFAIPNMITNHKLDNYMPPEGQKIDYNAQALDRVQNHLTNEQVMRNTVNGKHNVKR